MNQELAAIETERRGDQLVVSLGGEIDLSNAQPVQQRIEQAVEGASDVVVDLSAVEYIDSQGLRLLSQLIRRFAREGWRLRLVAPPGSFARGVLDLTRISEDVEVLDAVA